MKKSGLSLLLESVGAMLEQGKDACFLVGHLDYKREILPCKKAAGQSNARLKLRL